VLVVIEENHSEDQVFPHGMPYLWSLAQRYVRATAWSGVTHPSLPNYLAMLGGDAFGGPKDCPPGPGCSWSGSSVLGQALAHGRTVGVYEESMGAPCATGFDGGYDVNHNPWVYFTDERAACLRYDVPAGGPTAGAFRTAVADGLPTISLLVPDLDHDGHDGTLAQADAWLQDWLRPVLAGPDWTTGRLAVIVTFDEGETSERVPFVLMARDLRPATVTAPANHLSLSRLLSELAGGPPLRAAAGVPDVAGALGIATSP
jgi:acid phosphatase